MPNLNKIFLMGNLTRDPELRYTAKGTAVANIGLAVSRPWKDDEGKKNEETTFFRLKAFGKRAETLSKFLEKGRALFVEGRIDNWSFEGDDGQTRRGSDVIVEGFQFLPRYRAVEREEADPLAA